MISDREYIFASSYIKAWDSPLSPAERLSRIRECSSRDSVRSTAAELFKVTGNDPYNEAMLSAVNMLREILPDFSVVSPLLFKYDCNNIKTAIKCNIRGLSPEGMMFSYGTISEKEVWECAKSGDFSPLPEIFRKGAEEATELFSMTGEARAIDLILDKACFEQMKITADKSGCEETKSIVSLKADGTNLMTARRIGNSGLSTETATVLFRRAFVSGGEMELSAFISKEGNLRCTDDIALFARGISEKCIKDAAKKTPDGAARCIDESVLIYLMQFKFKPFGPHIPLTLLAVREAEITNLRLAEAAQGFKNRDEFLKERLRVAYV